MIRSPSKIAKCISKTLPGNLQRYRKAMQTKKNPKHLDLNAKHFSVSVAFSCLFSVFQNRPFSYWVRLQLTSLFLFVIKFSFLANLKGVQICHVYALYIHVATSRHFLHVIQQIDVSFLCVSPVIDYEFRNNIVKVAVDPRGDSRLL